MSVVEKNNTISVSVQSLESVKLNISWKQSLASRSADYYITEFLFNGHTGVIFIQANKIGEFKSKLSGDSVAVDSSFQYGQNKEKTKRFLVFHDKNNKPYQHRYVENVLTKYGTAGANFAGALGVPVVTQAADVAKWFIGDYLRDY